MSLQCPPLLPILLVANDAYLAARISCVLAQKGHYLPITDGPRMQRPDRDNEVVRRNNAAARVKATQVIFVGLDVEAKAALKSRFPHTPILDIASEVDVDSHLSRSNPNGASLICSKNKIGLSVLAALRNKQTIVFSDEAAPAATLPTISGHIVVCEEGDDLAQVIAANYAFSLDASLHLVPCVATAVKHGILERFYNLNDGQGASPTEKLTALKAELRELLTSVDFSTGSSVTFFTSGMPYGFAITEIPSTHILKYPNLGVNVVNGFAAEQPDQEGTGVAVLIDPSAELNADTTTASHALLSRQFVVRTNSYKGANVTAVSRITEFLPYEFMMFATHCGDTDGWRCRYEFEDSEGRQRVLVADLAIGLGRAHGEDMLEVMFHHRFVSLDGLEWADPRRRELTGTAMVDWNKLAGNNPPIHPVSKTKISRVYGSAGLKMYDHNYLVAPHSLAGNGSPIVLCNACVSWHALAGRFMFAGARAYIGTLFEILPIEAQVFVEGLLQKRLGELLPLAIWEAQNEMAADGPRRPYVMMGVYVQRLRAPGSGKFGKFGARLQSALEYWKQRLNKAPSGGDKKKLNVEEIVRFYEDETARFQYWLKSKYGN